MENESHSAKRPGPKSSAQTPAKKSEKLIEKSGYVSKSKYIALEKLANNLEKRIIDLENNAKE